MIDLKLKVIKDENNDIKVEIYNQIRVKDSLNFILSDTNFLKNCLEKYYKNNDIRITNIDIEDNVLINLNNDELCIIKLLNHQIIPIKDTILFQNNYFEANICIPYRARDNNFFRKNQLDRFIKHFKEYMLKNQPYIKYKIIILEQNNLLPFNRGLLLNIGFLECEKEYENINSKEQNKLCIPYYVHHNCDLFPIIDFDKKIDYSYTGINEVRDIFGYNGGIGGISIFNRISFKLVNGFPNNMNGWSNEDVLLLNRCKKKNLLIKRNNYNKGIYEENHKRDDSWHDINIKNGLNDNYETNGLSTCKYTCKKINSEFNQNNVIHYLFDFDFHFTPLKI